MKEKIYTIPLNDAVNADDECPFCFIERVVEQDLLDFVLGSGSSYMESDVREITDRTGFCRMHFKKMFDYGNTLGNGWILKTHYKKMNQELQEQFNKFTPGKSGFMARMKKPADTTSSIGATVFRTEQVAVAQGQLGLMSEGQLALTYVDEPDKLIAGDLVVTSGLGGYYPSGLPIGTVTELRTDTGGLTQYAVLSPKADIGALTQVFLITEFDVVE